MNTTRWNFVRAFLLALIALSSSVWGQSCPAPTTNGPTWIYEDGFGQGWSVSGAWSSNTITTATGVGQVGPFAIKTDFQSAWAGTGLYKTGDADISKVTALAFRVRMEQSGDLLVGIHRSATNTVDKWVSVPSGYITPYQSTPFVPGQWVNVFIPLLDLQISTTDNTIKGFVFQSSIATTMYLDDVMLVNAFLKFPLDCSANGCPAGSVDYRTTGAYTLSSVVSVMDHSMKLNPSSGQYPYGSDSTSLDGVVLSWTGELGNSNPSNPIAGRGCYPNVNGVPFSVMGTYTSDSCTTSKLNYDDHPGFDYRAGYGTPVKAAAAGHILSIEGEKCYKNNFASCAGMGAVGIDHANGYITQYLHMDPNTITVSAGAYVIQGQIIGYSSDTGVAGSPHLHFEVLWKASSSTTNNYKMVDPYGWNGTGIDSLQTLTGVKNYRLWK